MERTTEMPRTIKEQDELILASGLRGEKRSQLEDAKTRELILKTQGFEILSNLPEKGIDDEPSLVAANHYIRPPMARRDVSTSRDIATSGALIATAVTLFSQRDILFVQDGEINDKIMGFSCLDRKTQIAFMSVYDFIPAYKDPTKNSTTARRILGALKKGQNVAIYPEGTVDLRTRKGISYLMRPDRLREFNPNFEILLNLVLKGGFQVIPVSVYSVGKDYHVTLHESISAFCPNVAEEVITRIRSGLPRRLHGFYKNRLHAPATTPALQ